MIYPRIEELIADAIKSHDTVRTETLREIKTFIVKWVMDPQNKGKELNEESEQEVLTKLAGSYTTAIEEFKKMNRKDLIDSYTPQLAIIKEFLPEEPDDAVVEACAEQVVTDFIAENGAVTLKDTRDIIAKVKETYDTASVGKIVSVVIKRHIAKDVQ